MRRISGAPLLPEGLSSKNGGSGICENANRDSQQRKKGKFGVGKEMKVGRGKCISSNAGRAPDNWV